MGCNTGTRVSGGRPCLARREMRRVGGWATRSVAINSLPFSYISFHSDVNGVLGLPWIAWQLHVERHPEEVGLPFERGTGWRQLVQGGREHRAGLAGGVLAPEPSPLTFVRDRRLTNPQ